MCRVLQSCSNIRYCVYIGQSKFGCIDDVISELRINKNVALQVTYAPEETASYLTVLADPAVDIYRSTIAKYV